MDPLASNYPSHSPYIYSSNNPIIYIDPDGRSWLKFDGKTNTITLYNKNNKKVGSWSAYNNVAKKSSHGKWSDGTYKYSHQNLSKYSDAKDSDRIDSKGIIVFQVPDEDKKTKSKAAGSAGLGVHAGREGKEDKAGRKDEEYATYGCIRTTKEAMEMINETHKKDRVTELQVENNRKKKENESEKKDEDSK